MRMEFSGGERGLPDRETVVVDGGEAVVGQEYTYGMTTKDSLP